MRKLWAIVVITLTLTSITPGASLARIKTIADPGNMAIPPVVGKIPPLRTFIGPTFLYTEGSRIFIVEELMNRIQSLFPFNDYALGIMGQNVGQVYKTGGITSYKNNSYMVDSVMNKILVYSKMGVYESEFFINNQLGQPILVNPYGITVFQGRLYIANTGAGDIIVCDTEGKYIRSIGTKGSSDGELMNPTAVTVAAGKIFVTDPGNGHVVVFDLEGKFVKNIGSGNPWAISSFENTVYYTDYISNKVYIVNPDGIQVGVFGNPGNGPGQFAMPKGVTVLDGKIIVSSFLSNRVDSFDQEGKFIAPISTQEQVAGSLAKPIGIAMTTDNIIVTDSVRNKIIVYKKSGEYITEFGGTGDAVLNNPTGVAVDLTNNIYVADTQNHSIKVFGFDGSYKRTFGMMGHGKGKLSRPSDVAVVTSLNKIFVTDTGNNLVQIFSLTGDFLSQFGGYGNAPGEFNIPTGIVTDGKSLFIADSANCRIQELTLDGKPIKTYGSQGRNREKLFFPTDVAIDGGKIYVADTFNHRITEFDTKAGFSTFYGKAGGPDDQFHFIPATCPEPKNDKRALGFFKFPSGIATSESGILVADTENHRVQFIDYNTIFEDSTYLISPGMLDFGVIPSGTIIEENVYLMNISGGQLSGFIDIPEDAKWLRTHKKTFTGDEEALTFFIDSGGLSAGIYETDVKLITNKDGDSESKIVHVKAQIGDSYGYKIDLLPFIIKESTGRVEVLINLKPQNGYTGTAAINVKHNIPNAYFNFSEGLLTLSKKTDTVLTFKSANPLPPGIYTVTITAETPGLKYATQRDFIIVVSSNKNFAPRTVLGETFTAVWCINCPYAHRAAERLVEEKSTTRVVWLNYYVESKDDLAHLYYAPADKRYKWYPGQGLPTTFFDGLFSVVGGDNDDERKHPPKDKLPCDRFSGTTFTYNKYKTAVESRIMIPSPLDLFVDANMHDNFIETNIEIETLTSLGQAKNVCLYVVLAENNIEFPASNGDQIHTLVAREMYTGPLGESINLIEGQRFSKHLTLKLPSWVYLNNANLIVWVQNNNSKEIYQTTNINLYEQPAIGSYTVVTDEPQIKLEVGKEAEFKYYVTNTSTHQLTINCKPEVKADGWDYIFQVDGVEQRNSDFVIQLKPMESQIVSVKALPPEGTQPGQVATFNFKTSANPSDNQSEIISIETTPRLPPDFTFTSPVARAEITRLTKTEFDVKIDPINDFSGPVSISNCTDNPNITVIISPSTGVPPFKTHVTIEGGKDLQVGNSMLCLISSGTLDTGIELSHKINIPIEILHGTLVIDARPTRIISCSENQACHSSQIDIKITTPIAIKEAKFSVRYDPSVLTITHTMLGDFLSSKDTVVNFIDRPAEGIATVQILSPTEMNKGDGKLFTIVMRGQKGVTKLDTRVEICDAQMFGENTERVLANLGCQLINLDIISQIPPPTLTVDFEDGITVDQDFFVIDGKVVSGDPNYPVSLHLNGIIVPLATDGSFEYKASLREGPNKFVFVAEDESGSSTGLKKTINRDSTPPGIFLVDLQDGQTVKTPIITINGWVDEPAMITINGKPVQVNDYREFNYSLVLIDGSNKITITATDKIGKISTLEITINLKRSVVIQFTLDKLDYMVNGEKMQLKVAPTNTAPPLPKILAGNTFMTITEVAVALGVNVAYDSKERKVTLTQVLPGNITKKIELWIGKKASKIDGKEVWIDSKRKLYPIIVNNKTMLPLRFVGEALGAQVEYEAKMRNIKLTYPKP